MGVLDIVPAGVVSGKDVYKVFDYARENKFAIPAFNVTVSIRSGKKGVRTVEMWAVALLERNRGLLKRAHAELAQPKRR